jgi:hypothetical protein
MKMVIKTTLIKKLLGFDGYCLYPFIFMHTPSDKALYEHEMVHYREQKKMFVIGWLFAYQFSKKFRLGCELRAYAAQIRHSSNPEEYTWAAKHMVNLYNFDLTVLEAHALLTEELNKKV